MNKKDNYYALLNCLIFYSIVFLFFPSTLSCQQNKPDIKIVETWHQEAVTDSYFRELLATFGKNKKLPIGYEKQALLALSYYPELKETKIIFKVRKKGGAPFVSRPTSWSLLFRKPSKRKYRILISQKTKEVLDPILMKRLPFNAQVGVLGHELAHTSFYLQKKLGAMLRIAFGIFSNSYLDKFENQTDRIAIEHGLGFQLLSWSETTHSVFTPKFANRGVFNNIFENERYLYPETIRQLISTLEIYRN